MITSKDNPQIKELRKLQDKRQRAKLGLFAAEGEDLVAAALSAGLSPQTLFCSADAPSEFNNHQSALEVDSDVLASASALGSGARVIGVFEVPGQEGEIGSSACLYLEGVGDPGNVGTAIRSAAALCGGNVLLGEGCADPYSPKALRAAMGSTFTHPPSAHPGEISVQWNVVALDANGGVPLDQIDVEAPLLICAGSERDGLSPRTLERADTVARIPMTENGPESLNVAAAATIALYELSKGIAGKSAS